METIGDPVSESGLAIAMAQYHLSRRHLAAARDVLSSFLAQPPESAQSRQALADTFCALARAHAARREIDLAKSALDAAQRLADGPAVWRVAAALATTQRDPVAALALWKQVVTAEPEDHAAWLALARASEAAGSAREAVDAYVQAAQTTLDHSTTLAIAERLATLSPVDSDTPPEQAVRIAIIGSSTFDHVRAYLEVSCRVAGLVPTFYVGPYRQYAQDILSPESPLYAFAPDVIIVAIHGRALFPELYDNPFALEVEARRAAAQDVVSRVATLLTQLTARTSALVLLHSFATPQYSPIGTLDLRDTFGQTALFQAINTGIAERVRQEFASVHVIDEERVYGRIGKHNVTDPRLWFLARIGIGEGALSALASEYMRYIKALKSRTRKCLVLDLDNTLWGGVIGEDGPHGIALGQEAPGNAYLAFQQAILGLWKRGIILAINSKNNEADALEVLEHHPDMVLRPKHFAAMRINWQDKVTNLRSIAAELNIGLDSLAFVDDNPVECARVRAQVPEVLTVQLPRDPALYRSTLLELTDFDTLALTQEDRERGKLYAQRRERQEWETRHADHLDAYLSDLGVAVEVSQADEFSIPRIAQLIGKTNQFNLTTRRHSEAAVRAFTAAPDHRVYSAQVRDRFGEHGLTGAAIIATRDDVWEVETLLLSCRVLGCGVETAVLSALVADARASGARVLRGLFAPTAKNEPARDFYPQHGFAFVDDQDGVQRWELDLSASDVAVPDWTTLRMGQGASTGA